MTLNAGPSAVVFDLDGTLVDSVPDIASAVNAALRSFNLRELDEGHVASMVGNGSEVLIARALAAATGAPPRDDFSRAVHDEFIAAYDREPCRLSRLYPGARDVLDALTASGIKLAICTNKPEGITAAVLDQLGIAALFASVVGGSARLPLKPAPDMLQAALRKLGASATTSVMVGDSAADAGTAKSAGTRLVLLQHGYSRGADLARLGADAVLPDFSGFMGALARVTARAP